MSVKTENHWGMLKDIWKIMWPAALPLYLSYFYYRFVGVYTSGCCTETGTWPTAGSS